MLVFFVFLSSTDFLKIIFFEKFVLTVIPSECQTIWTQIRLYNAKVISRRLVDKSLSWRGFRKVESSPMTRQCVVYMIHVCTSKFTGQGQVENLFPEHNLHTLRLIIESLGTSTGPRSAVGNVSDCRSRGSEFDPAARSHTFVEIDHEIISTAIFLSSAETFKKGCCQLQAKVCTRSTG